MMSDAIHVAHLKQDEVAGKKALILILILFGRQKRFKAENRGEDL